ncbi:MAG TPA: aminotransferase class I/II-fold pyridoxal phosphate-dependent enzyme [Candidatus Saccharimonadales bacterium]|nr:aminotransferase class I/II-fold pyridoxal phosphate-dependent enzyme [Candidatus Saccharimonadales bacterium]
MKQPRFTGLIESLPAVVPFVPPEALERNSGRPLRLRLGANESVFGASPRARKAMAEAAKRISWYGDPESFLLREKLAHIHGLRMENLSVGSGIDDLLGLVVRTFVETGTPVVTSLGAYPTFDYHVAGYGGKIHYVPYRNDHNDLEALAEMAQRVDARLVYLANPDNPTGTWYNAASLKEFLDRLPGGCLLILDEAYLEFVLQPDGPAVDAGDPRVICMRTFSKAHGMAGARIGYAIAAPQIVTAFDKVRNHFGVNLFGQVGALASLEDPEFIEQVHALVEHGRQDYYSLARELGLRAIPSSANFVALDLGSEAAALSLLKTLMERDVFVRRPGAPPLNRLIRVTVGTPAARTELRKLLHQLAAAKLIPSNDVQAGA